MLKNIYEIEYVKNKIDFLRNIYGINKQIKCDGLDMYKSNENDIFYYGHGINLELYQNFKIKNVQISKKYFDYLIGNIVMGIQYKEFLNLSKMNEVLRVEYSLDQNGKLINFEFVTINYTITLENEKLYLSEIYEDKKILTCEFDELKKITYYIEKTCENDFNTNALNNDFYSKIIQLHKENLIKTNL